MIQGKKVLITGGAGFIGTSLATRLLQGDNSIVLFDNLHQDALRHTDLLTRGNVTLIEGDVRDYSKLKAAMEGCHVVVHMASIAGVDTVLKMPVETMLVNLVGTQNTIAAVAELPSLERFVHFSTSEVFGRFAYQAAEENVTELGAVGEARWTYAVSKLACEHLCQAYYRESEIPVVSIRPFNIYGPNQVGTGAVHSFIVKALQGEPLTIHNSGNQIRSWCYIDDFVDGVLLCIEKSAAVGETFNIGNPRSAFNIYHLAKMIIKLAESNSPIVEAFHRFTDVEIRTPSIEKSSELLGFSPKVDLEDGLSRTIEWYRNNIVQ